MRFACVAWALLGHSVKQMLNTGKFTYFHEFFTENCEDIVILRLYHSLAKIILIATRKLIGYPFVIQ